MEIRVHKHLLYTYLKGNSFDLEELFANRIFHKMMVIKQREVKSNILLDSLGSGKTIKLITEFIANQQESLYITKNSRLKKNVVECILKMGFPVDNKRVINIGNPKIKLDQNIDIKHFYIDDLLFYTNKEINDVIELINKHIIKGSIIHVASSAIINKIPLLFEFINKYEFSLEYEYQKMFQVVILRLLWDCCSNLQPIHVSKTIFCLTVYSLGYLI